MQVPAGNANAITGEAAVVPSLGSKLGKALKSAIPFAQIFAEESSAPEMPGDHKAEGIEEKAGNPAEFGNMLSQEKPDASQTASMQTANPQTAGKAIGQTAALPGTAATAAIFQMQMSQGASKSEVSAAVENGEEIKSSSEHDGSKHSPVHRQHVEEASRSTATSSQDVLDGKSIPSIAPFSVTVPVQPRVEPVSSGARREPALQELSSQPSTNHKTLQSPHEMSLQETHAGSVVAPDAVSEMAAKSPVGKPATPEANGKEQHLSSPLVSASTNQTSSASASADTATLHETKASFAGMTEPGLQPVPPVSENDVRAAMLQQAAASGKQKAPGKPETSDARSIKTSGLEPGMSPSTQAGMAAGSGAIPAETGRHVSAGNNNTSGTDNNPFQHLDAGDTQATLMHSNAREVVVGVRDPSLGWVEIQTQSSGGHVSASLAAVSPEAHASLAAQAPAIAQYLEDRNVHVHTLDVGMQAGAQHGNDGQQPSSGNAEREAFQPQAATRGQAQAHVSSTERSEENVPVATSARISVRA